MYSLEKSIVWPSIYIYIRTLEELKDGGPQRWVSTCLTFRALFDVFKPNLQRANDRTFSLTLVCRAIDHKVNYCLEVQTMSYLTSYSTVYIYVDSAFRGKEIKDLVMEKIIVS